MTIHIFGRGVGYDVMEPQFQSQGIGAVLLQYAVQKRNAVSLWVLEYNTCGIAFYKKNGFQLTGEKKIEDDIVPLLKMERISE